MTHSYKKIYSQKIVLLSAICEISILQYRDESRYVSNNSTDFIEQPAETDTHYKCRDACLGPKRDGILPSGQSCHGSIFKNGRCRLAIAILDFQVGTRVNDGSVRYRLEYRCFSANIPSKFSFTSHNRQSKEPRYGSQLTCVS